MQTDDEFLPHYLKQLDSLRQDGADFAQKYPDVADGLDIAHRNVDDPQIDRLVESFAFLTAKLHQQYEAQFPEIPTAILEALYPQLLAPVPSMAIGEFTIDPAQAQSLLGVEVPRQTLLFATANGAAECKFQTAYPLRLWPIQVSSVSAQNPAEIQPGRTGSLLETDHAVAMCLRVTLTCVGKTVQFGAFSPPSLRFYLDGEVATRFRLQELLCNNLISIVAETPGKDPGSMLQARLGKARVRAVGLDAGDAILPYPTAAHEGYRLLQEYFAFPDKFMFIDVDGLCVGDLGAGTSVDLLFLFNEGLADGMRVTANSFRLGCVPIVNLFPRTSEPIRLDHLSVEYLLSPDARFAGTTEIHSVLSISRAAAPRGPDDILQPFFSALADPETSAISAPDRSVAGGLRWLARRQKPANPARSGSEVLLSFVDREMRPDQPADQVLFAQLLCTNRGLAAQLPARAKLSVDADLPVKQMQCLNRPTLPANAVFTGENLWRLVSHLSLNKLSLTGGASGLAALKQILRLYAGGFDRTRKLNQIDGLVELSTRSDVGFHGMPPWRGFVRGVEITMVLDDGKFAGGSAFLFASVMERFFALYAGVNSYTRLRIRRKGKDVDWKVWPARAGDRFDL